MTNTQTEIEAVAMELCFADHEECDKADTPQSRWVKIAPNWKKLFIVNAKIAIEAHKQALSEAGFVIVPKEPTDEMVAAGVGAILSQEWSTGTWKAMIAASQESE